ncbi:MAG TPA: hypothetical protein VF092_09650 [Longimicrobium sp.]
MTEKLSDAFGVSNEAWIGEGAFDAFVEIDSRFHVDPHLLAVSAVPELQSAYTTFTRYFEEIIRLLDAAQTRTDPMFRTAVRKLVFREIPGVALGYSKGNISGSGIGIGLAKGIAETAQEIVAAGIKDPAIFELVGLFEEGIGADRISDMTIHIILSNLIDFSQRVAQNLGLRTKSYKWRDGLVSLPYLPQRGQLTILVPYDILSSLPVALDWDDIDLVSTYNEALRQQVNRTIGETWKRESKRITKRQLRDALLRSPQTLRSFLDEYKGRPADHYDFARDPEGELVWHEIAKEYSKRFPLTFREHRVAPENILKVVTTICDHFANLIEANGLFHVFYNDDQELRNERFAQLLFYGIADAYCAANNFDLNREPNAGRGPVDFKISHGYAARVNVEVKYSSNPRLVTGYQKQLPIYDAAERTMHSIYLIIRTTQSTGAIEAVLQLETKQLNAGMRAPKVIVVDGRFKPSASKA